MRWTRLIFSHRKLIDARRFLRQIALAMNDRDSKPAIPTPSKSAAKRSRRPVRKPTPPSPRAYTLDMGQVAEQFRPVVDATDDDEQE
jgi:hypothetical protein